MLLNARWTNFQLIHGENKLYVDDDDDDDDDDGDDDDDDDFVRFVLDQHV